MATPTSTRRFTASCLIVAAILFAAFPLLRPWADKDGTSSGLLEAMASPFWVAAHVAGAFAFVALLLSAMGVRELHRDHRSARAATVGVVLLTVGSGSTLLYYGAETFALHTIAASPPPQAEALIAGIREGSAQTTLFGIGLLLIAAGAVLVAITVWRGSLLPRWSALPLAVTVTLYLPQFFAPPGARITHGILTAVAALWCAAVVLRTGAPSRPQSPRSPEQDE